MPSDYANELMSRVGLDTTEWKKGITDINAGIKHIETGFKASAALMDGWGESSEGLKLRVDSLNDELELQKKKLDILRTAYQETVKEQGATSEEAENLASKMFDAEKQVTSTTKKIEDYSRKLAEQAVKKQKEFADQLKNTGDKLEKVGGKISSVGNSLTTRITAPVIAAGAAIYKYSSDLTEAENKMEATFGSASEEISEWASNSINSVGMARSTALDAVSLYGDMATSMGLTQREAAKMSMSLVGLSADLSSFKNISIDTATTALKGIFTGETESLKGLGVVMTEAQLKAYALAQGFEKSYTELTQAEKVQLRYNFVIDASKNAIGDYGRTSGEAASQMRKLPEALKELAASFKEEVEPVVTPLIKSLNEIIQKFGELDEDQKKAIVNTAVVAAATGPVVSAGGKVVGTVGQILTGIGSLKALKIAKGLAEAGTAATAAGAGAEVAAGGVATLGTAASVAAPYLAVVGVLLAALAAAAIDTKKKLSEVDDMYDEYIEKEKDAAKTEKENLNSLIKNTEKIRDDKINAYQAEYNAGVTAAEEYVEKSKKALEEERKAFEKNHSAKLKLIEKEKKARQDAVDADKKAKNAELQGQIDAIDAEIAAEEKAKEEAEAAQKIKDLQIQIAAATTMTDKRNAEKELTAFLAEQQQKKVADEREALRESLREQMSFNDELAADEKSRIDEEYAALKENLEAENESYKEAYEERLAFFDGYVENEKTRLEDLKTANELAVTNWANTVIEEYERVKKELEEGLELKITYAEQYREDEKNRVKNGLDVEEFGKSGELKRIDGTEFFGYQQALGTDYFRGGWTYVNEQGGEIINLPRGSQIIPHDISKEMARAYARQAGEVKTTNNTTNNYGAQQQVTVFKIGEEVVTTAIQHTLSVDAERKARSRGRALGVAGK